MDTTHDTRPDPAQVGGYIVEAELGRGGMGVVYAARRGAEAPVALKTVTKPSAFAVRALRAEIAVLARLDHPGVVRLVDHDATGAVPWYAMALVKGRSMHAMLRDDAGRALAEAATSVPIAPNTAHDAHTSYMGVTRDTGAWTREATAAPSSAAPLPSRTLDPTASTAAPATEVTQAGLHPLDPTARVEVGAESTRFGRLDDSTEAPEGASSAFELTRATGFGPATSTPTRPPNAAAARQRSPLDSPERVSARAPNTRALRWLYQVAQTLAYLHGQGVVHADLKPANILIDEGGRAVLLDFGLATLSGSRTSAADLDRAGVLAGSLSYINPEQIRGDVLDARSDLYALGCLLFEALTGRPPFVARDARALIARHLGAPVPALVGLPETFALLGEVVTALLAKAPNARPGHARAVLHALERCGCASPWPGVAREVERPYVFRPELVGRDALIERLMDRLRRAAHGAGTLTLLHGEAGVGKTRALRALVRRARGGGRDVLSGGAARAGGGVERPLGVWLPVLRAISDAGRALGREQTLERLGHDNVAALAPYVPALAWLAPPEPSAQHAPASARVALQRVFRALMRALQRWTRHNAALIILDDLQWADELSLGALAYVCDELEGTRWAVVGCVRPSEAPGALQALIDAHPDACAHVAPLSASDVEVVVGQTLGQPPQAELNRAVFARAGGNPFFIAEYLRMAAELGLLERNPSGQWVFSPHDAQARLGAWAEPDSVRDVLVARLGRLTGEARAVCDAASVLGNVVEDAELVALTELAPHALDSALDVLCDQRVLERDDAAPGRARFAQALLRDVAYAQLDPDARVRLHRRAAHACANASAATRAHHWDRAGVHERARACYIEAAELAVARWALEEAQRCYMAALALEDEDTQDAIDLRLALVERVLLKRSDHALTLEHAHRLVALCARHPQAHIDAHLARAHLALAETYGTTHLHTPDQFAKARHHASEALVIAGRVDAPRLKACALERLGTIEVNANDWSREAGERARVLYESALALASDTHSAAERAHLIHALGTIHANQTRFDQARAAYLRALDLQMSAGDLHGASLTRFNLGRMLFDAGHHAEAIRAYEAAKRGFDALGNRMGEAITLNNLGVLYMDTCAYTHARDAYRYSLDIRRRLKSPTVVARANLAFALACLGDLAEATALSAQALDEGRGASIEVELVRVRARVAWLRGDIETILEEVRLERIDPNTYNGQHCQSAFARLRALAQLACGELDDAETLAREAIRRAPHGAIFQRARARVVLGRVLTERACYAPAEVALADAMADLADHAGVFDDVRAYALRARALFHHRRGALKAAARDADAALERFGAIDHRVGVILALCAVAQIALDQDQRSAAQSAFARAQAEAESLDLTPESEARVALGALGARIAVVGP